MNRFFLLCVTFFTSTLLGSPSKEPIHKGQLSNGLTYYVQKSCTKDPILISLMVKTSPVENLRGKQIADFLEKNLLHCFEMTPDQELLWANNLLREEAPLPHLTINTCGSNTTICLELATDCKESRLEKTLFLLYLLITKASFKDALFQAQLVKTPLTQEEVSNFYQTYFTQPKNIAISLIGVPHLDKAKKFLENSFLPLTRAENTPFSERQNRNCMNQHFFSQKHQQGLRFSPLCINKIKTPFHVRFIEKEPTWGKSPHTNLQKIYEEAFFYLFLFSKDSSISFNRDFFSPFHRQVNLFFSCRNRKKLSQSVKRLEENVKFLRQFGLPEETLEQLKKHQQKHIQDCLFAAGLSPQLLLKKKSKPFSLKKHL